MDKENDKHGKDTHGPQARGIRAGDRAEDRLKNVPIQDVKKFWEANPVCASAIPHELGSREYFETFNQMREANESPDFLREVHEFDRFQGKRVLDIGCGNGFVLEHYAKAGAEVWGVDITERAIELSRKRFALSGLKGMFQTANAEKLPFDDETFDCVCSMGVLHHTPNTSRAIDEIYRVLKPQGRLILMFYHRNSAWYRFALPVKALLSGKSLQQVVNEVDGAGNPKGDVYSRNELKTLLQDFSDLEFFTGLFYLDQVAARFVPALKGLGAPRFLERNFGWCLYGKGNKAKAGKA